MKNEKIRSVWVRYQTLKKDFAIVVNLSGCENLPQKAVECIAIAVVCKNEERDKYVKIIEATELSRDFEECDCEC